jgi:hypothetical protein
MRLDEEKLEALRRWGRGLEQADGEESAAAGRAILMLIAELERLQIDLRLAREQASRPAPPSSDEAAEEQDQPVASSLHERLQRVLRRDSDPVPPSRSQPGEDAAGEETAGTTPSPQAWIEALRKSQD